MATMRIFPSATAPLIQQLLSEDDTEFAVVHGRGQYSEQGGASSCGIAALNCARIVLGKELAGLRGEELILSVLRPETFDEVLGICASWASSAHLDVEDIYQTPVFHRSLSLTATEFGQTSLGNLMTLLRALQRPVTASGRSSCAVITRPPEIISCFCLGPWGSTFVIFDSHPRPNLHPNGAAFICFASLDGAAGYLDALLHIDAGIMDGDVQWQTQLLGNFSGHIFVAKALTNSADSWMDAAMEASLQALHFHAECLQLKSRNSALNGENTRLRQLRALQSSYIERSSRRDSETSCVAGSSSQRPDKPLPAQPDAGAMTARLHHEKLQKYFGAYLEQQRARSSKRDYEASSVAGSSSQRPDRPVPTQPNDEDMKVHHERLRNFFRARLQEQDARNGVNGSGRADPPPRRPSDSNNRRPLGSPSRVGGGGTTSDVALARQLQMLFNEEHVRLTGERGELVDHKLGTFDCGVCMESLSEEFVSVVPECQHRYCRQCIRAHVVSELASRRFPIQCPLCKADRYRREATVLDNAFVQHIGLSEEQYALFVQLELMPFATAVECRSCHASFLVDKEEYDEDDIVTCPLPACQSSWCKFCNQVVDPDEDDPKHSCDGSNEFSHLMGERGWKYCPGCKIAAEKIDGCNHMACTSPGCNTHFCYLCGSEITRSVRGQEISDAVQKHYSKCAMFEDVPEL